MKQRRFTDPENGPDQGLGSNKPAKLILPLAIGMAVLTALPVSAPADPPALEASDAPVRACGYVPGVSVPAKMPAGVADRPHIDVKPYSPPAPISVDPKDTALELSVLNGLSSAVNDHYVYTDFNGHDWPALVAKYRALIEGGMRVDAFYGAMEALISELGDEHSYFQSPQEIQAEKAALTSQYNFVGVGALFLPIGLDRAAIMTLMEGGPGAEAGLQPHDTLLSVDRGPIRDSSGYSRTRGPEGTTVQLRIERPGEAPRDITLTRRRVTGRLPIEYCLISAARIGYIFLPTMLDQTMGDQVREALQKLTADGPLAGLVLDNRVNGGGLGSVDQAILDLFASGIPGEYVTRDSREPLKLAPEDIGGSQSVPLTVLIDVDTVSYGEILSGVLRVSGRAKLLGGRTRGNVEQLRSYTFGDGSRAWLASATFQPRGMANGVWEKQGLVPDVALPTRWDLFTEADDPALAKAVELLTTKPEPTSVGPDH